jgi:hypothetical protein
MATESACPLRESSYRRENTPASVGDINKLRANAGDKVTVVHFWNTNTPDVATNFNQLETTYRMDRGRSFDFVTVNTIRPQIQTRQRSS